MFTMAIALRSDFKYPHASVDDKSALLILQRQQECCVSLLCQTRNVILQTLYHMLDEEMDSLKPALLPMMCDSQNSRRHSFLVAEFLPFLSILLWEMPPVWAK